MKYLKIKYNGKLYQFEAESKISLIKLIEEKKKTLNISNIELLTSNVFKIKNGLNEELKQIFNS